LYDAKTLKSAIEESGFANVKRVSPGESEDKELRAVESHGKLIGDENNHFETMVMEAIRPHGPPLCSNK
jgi:hypothetical protein